MPKFIFKTIFVLILLTTIICGDQECINKSGFKQPITEQVDKDGWEKYVNTINLDQKIVSGLNPGLGSPEATVVQFYSSIIRGDKCFELALPVNRDKYEIDQSLKEISSWKFIEVKLLARHKNGDDSYWIKLKMKIKIEGSIESGTDEATVKRINGKWYVVEIPI
jgi:hypothetical protein